jgi:hypothetical protein
VFQLIIMPPPTVDAPERLPVQQRLGLAQFLSASGLASCGVGCMLYLASLHVGKKGDVLNDALAVSRLEGAHCTHWPSPLIKRLDSSHMQRGSSRVVLVLDCLSMQTCTKWRTCSPH